MCSYESEITVDNVEVIENIYEVLAELNAMTTSFVWHADCILKIQKLKKKLNY